MFIAAAAYLTIPEGRYRKAFDEEKHQRLKASIRNKGLMHPLVVQRVSGEPRSENWFELVAGERRFRAITALHEEEAAFRCNAAAVPAGHYPCILLSDLTPLQVREAELEENICRENLTWSEELAAVHELHQLRCEQDPRQTKQATARELAATASMSPAYATAAVSCATVVAPHLTDPEVAKARDAKEAYSIVSRKLEREFRGALAAQAPSKSPHTLILGDLVKVLPTLPAESFDCIIADPPYGMGADTFGDAAKLAHGYDDSPLKARELNENLLALTSRVAKPKAHLYLFCDIDHFLHLREWSTRWGWTPWRTPFIWTKGPAGHAPDREHGPRRGYELLLYAVQGGRRVTELASDVLAFPAVQEKDHAAQKPVDLYVDLLRRSCLPGDMVLDPCCGVGTVFAAARRLKLIATGVEKDAGAHALALGRMEGDG